MVTGFLMEYLGVQRPSNHHSCVLMEHCLARRVKRLINDQKTLVQLCFSTAENCLTKSESFHGKHEIVWVTPPNF